MQVRPGLTHPVISFGFLVLLISSTGSQAADPDESARAFQRWKHFSICSALPGSAWGTGGIGVADFNQDGRPDVAVSRREPKTAYWFERKDDATWTQHTLATAAALERTLGAAVLDLDLDGWTDIAFWGV